MNSIKRANSHKLFRTHKLVVKMCNSTNLQVQLNYSAVVRLYRSGHVPRDG